MNLSNVKVEQINHIGEIVRDYGEINTKKEISSFLMQNFPIVKNEKDQYIGIYKGVKFSIVPKNISYLGNPHPIFKKRIQIPRDFKKIYEKNMKKNIITVLLGIYTYKGVLMFCDFEVSGYIENSLNNSSAHLYSNDLLVTFRNGTFQRSDKNGNIITMFNAKSIIKYLEYKLFGKNDIQFKIVKVFDDFFDSLPLKWNGKECYKEMNDNGFSNANQPEWPGFYLEYKLEKYLKQNGFKDIKYVQNKKKDEIDLDLEFPELNCYGDLKTHSTTSSAIQGNDKDTMMNVLNECNIYYIVCSHDTVKDKEMGYEVTQFWNKMLGKEKLMSYSEKMKNSVTLKNYIILEISKDNIRYLKDFKQGKNSNGKERKTKISISMRDIDYFIIHKKVLSKAK